MVNTRRPSGWTAASGQLSRQNEEVNQTHTSHEENQIPVTNQPDQHVIQQESCLVTRQNFDNVVNQINENLQRTIRAMALSLQNGGEGNSRPPPPGSPSRVTPHHLPSPTRPSLRANEDDQLSPSPRNRRLYSREKGYNQQSDTIAQRGRRVPTTLRTDARNVINQTVALVKFWWCQ